MTCIEHSLLDEVSTLRDTMSVTAAIRKFKQAGGSAAAAFPIGILRSVSSRLAGQEPPWGLGVALANLAGEKLPDGRRVDAAFWQSYLGLNLA